MNSELESESNIQTIRDLIDHGAQTQPDAAYLISPETGRTLSFRELREQCSFLSLLLRQAGLERGDKIAFLMDNGLFTAQLFLGAMYGGFVAVPLNVRAGASQLSYTLDHCDAGVVFVEEKYTVLIKEVLAGVRRALRVIPANVDCLAAERVTEVPVTPPPLPVPAPGDVALLMYTSGSTGQPKAAVHSHRTILAGASNSVISHQLTSADRSLLVLPLYHINAECVTLIPALLSGGSVVAPHHFVVSQFWDWMDQHRCTWSALVPTIISQLLDWKDPRAHNRQAAFERIRFLRSSSAPLSPSLHREFLDKFKLPLIQAMGSTEAGNMFSNPVPPGANKLGSPGLPWGFETRIVNSQGAELPAGEPGEVLIRGAAMMQGYYKDPVATAAALDTEGWLHTGDLAYRDQEGYFFVIGRSKELIIKGGMNIAPRQIDEVLESHPAVLEAAAVGVPDRYVGEDLVAFAVLREGMRCDERELLSFCENRLGHFKTPTRIHFVDDLPKGPSGKVQRLRLVEEAARPEVARSISLAGESEAPMPGANGEPKGLPATDPAIEQIIAEIWSELLAQSQIDAQSNFFALGGHSLLAIQCLSRLREKVPVMLSLTDFFENATIAQQAALVRKKLLNSPARETAGAAPTPVDSQPIPLRDRNLPCPLSPAQQRVWFMEQLAPQSPTYNESEAVRLTGYLNADALEDAFNIIIGRHELLRATIQSSNGQPSFVIHDDWPLEFRRIDLGALSAPDREAELERLLVSEPRQPYHLETSPGIRTTLVRLGRQEHVLILMMHHIICDWSSEGVLWRELSLLYRALLRGEPLNLPPLPIQHGDYAAWQQEHYAPVNFAKDLAFWKETLKGAPEVLELPADRPRPPTASQQGNRMRFQIDSTQAEALRQLSRREKVSLFTVFATALNVLLHRYTASEDILLGIPLADRDHPELQSMIGFLLHTQVLRTEVNPNMNFSALLSRVQKGTLDMFTHRDVPFELVVREVGQERNLSYSPLFQVMLNWRDREQQLSYIGLEGLKVESLLAHSETSKFDFLLSVTDDGSEIWLEMEYSTDLFDQARIVRMAGHYQTLLAAVASAPDQRLSDLPLLTETERHQILVEWNRTEVDYPRDSCLHDLIEAQVERTPEAVAVVFGNQQLTYRELNARANQLARHLQKLGVGPDSLVGICVERSLEMAIGILGILKAGGAYVPLDPTYPRQRLAFMVEDTRVCVLLTQQRIGETVSMKGVRTLTLDTDWPRIASESTENPQSKAAAHHLAYVIYTSGSTGQPKGVAMGRQALANLISWQCKDPVSRIGLKTLQFASLNFDVSFQEIFSTWSSGGTLILIPEELRRDVASLLRVLNDEGVERLFLPFVALEHLAEMAAHQHLFPSSLRQIITAGEQLQITPRIRDFFEKIPACSLQNQYGPTEAHVVTAFTLHGPLAQWPKLPPIGRPIPNVTIFMLDKAQKPVPIGVPGELYIGGICLAHGYLNRPELTDQKFVSIPIGSERPIRLYRTGDLARLLPDGNIEFLGRSDFQVKIRGFRIEVGEIEAAMRLHSAVERAVVMAREDRPGDKKLVAYITRRNGKLSPSELRGFLGQKLPDYMIPTAFVMLESMPLSPNGKVDRRALPEPDFESPTDQFVPPATSAEVALAKIWSEVLGLKQVGLHDNFFDLGGHSLLMLRVQTRLGEVFNTQVSIAEMFQYPTISSLTRHLSQPTAGPSRLHEVRERVRLQTEAFGRQRQMRSK